MEKEVEWTQVKKKKKNLSDTSASMKKSSTLGAVILNGEGKIKRNPHM